MFKKFVKKTELDGMPSISRRKKYNFSTYTLADWKGTITTADATMDGYTVKFSFLYFKKWKSVICKVTFPKLNLNYSPKGKQMIIDGHKAFTFDFGSNTATTSTVVRYERNIKRKEEFDTVLQNFRREWNSSGLYKLMMDLRKI